MCGRARVRACVCASTQTCDEFRSSCEGLSEKPVMHQHHRHQQSRVKIKILCKPSPSAHRFFSSGGGTVQWHLAGVCCILQVSLLDAFREGSGMCLRYAYILTSRTCQLFYIMFSSGRVRFTMTVAQALWRVPSKRRGHQWVEFSLAFQDVVIRVFVMLGCSSSFSYKQLQND